VVVVLDTNAVVSALLFSQGQLSWLRHFWQGSDVSVLSSKATIDELIRVLAYPKFELDREEINALLADFLPYVIAVDVAPTKSNPMCRDPDDQIFVDLAISGKANYLVTGDKALLEMKLYCEVITPREMKLLVDSS